jgi:hypothetical protein
VRVCSGKFQAATVLRQYLDPLAWAFDLQCRPRLPGKRLSLVLSLVRTVHLILGSGGIICDSIHLDPTHMHHADRPVLPLNMVDNSTSLCERISGWLSPHSTVQVG